MKNNIFKSILMLGTVAVSFSACDLDEYDPNKVTGNEYLEQYEYYQGLVNKCYSPLINTFYQSSDYVALCEAGTDLWQAPQNGTSLEKYHYYMNMNADDSYVQKVWKFAYNTINTCNSVVQRAENVADATPEQITQAIAQARCLRAFYYYVLVEQFGNVTLTLDDSTLGDVDFYPTRSTVAEIYAAIITDLKYAVQNLPTSWPAEEYSRVTKKSALGLLCRAYIQGAAYDLTDEETGKSYLEMAYDTATDFIANKDTYGAYLYPSFADVFNEQNNRNNKEALFIAAGANRTSDAYSNGNYTQSEVFRHFLPSFGTYTDLGLVDKTSNFVYGRPNSNLFLPSKYLLECMQEDPNDIRYRYSFISAYSAYSCVLWGETFFYDGVAKELTADLVAKYGLSTDHVGKKLYPHFELIDNSNGALGVWNADGTANTPIEETEGNVLHPEMPLPAEDSYQYSVYVSLPTLTSEEKAAYDCFVVNAMDLYEADGQPKVNTTVGGVSGSSLEVSIYPAMSKFNMPGKEFFGSNAQRKTVDMMVMRFAEVYLIAAEASVRLGKGDAATYLNPLRERANAADAPASVDMDYIYDEYAREMCGEFNRWYLLKRNKAFEERLQEYNPRAAQHFRSTNYVRPISQEFLDAIYNAGEHGQNPGY